MLLVEVRGPCTFATPIKPLGLESHTRLGIQEVAVKVVLEPSLSVFVYRVAGTRCHVASRAHPTLPGADVIYKF